MKNKQIHIVKVVSRNFLRDFIARIENLVGANLTSYERMINDAMAQIKDEVESRKLEFSWFRYETTQLTNGAMAIMLYGETK